MGIEELEFLAENPARGNSTTFVLGAGFSKCAGLPLQSDFPALLLSPKFNGELDLAITDALTGFVRDVFGWKQGANLPSLEDVFTFIDLSAGSGHHLGIKYTPKMLRAIRRMAIYRIFSALDSQFTYSADINKLLNSYLGSQDAAGRTNFIVLNWDIVLEKHLRHKSFNPGIDYCCTCYDWNNPMEEAAAVGVKICKMHGSSNWVYCDNCKSLFFDLDQKLSLHIRAGLVKSDFRLFDESFTDKKFDSALGINSTERQCKFCMNIVSSHIATFSYRKSFRTHAYPSIWYDAERKLADSDHWVFIGYSLPEADYELKHLLKNAQLRISHLQHQKKRIEVVALGDNSRSRFERFFGEDTLDFHDKGLSEYVSHL